jgi:hypothetical protein
VTFSFLTFYYRPKLFKPRKSLATQRQHQQQLGLEVHWQMVASSISRGKGIQVGEPAHEVAPCLKPRPRGDGAFMDHDDFYDLYCFGQI